MKKQDRYFNIFAKTLLVIVTLCSLVPMLLVLMVSITEENTIIANGYSLFPKQLSLSAYVTLFDNDRFFNSVINSVIITGIGTFFAVLITAMAGYGLANPSVRYRGKISLYFYVTMVFSAGIVPWYMVCQALGLLNNFRGLIIPRLLFTTFNLFLVRNFMQGIPNEIREAAIVDGANDFKIAFRIYFPLALPVLATIVLFYGINYWNDWYNSVMLAPFNEKIYPIQYLLYKLKNEIDMLEELQELGDTTGAEVLPGESLKMATVIVTIGPIVLLYPFLQRYFIKGLLIGAVKG